MVFDSIIGTLNAMGFYGFVLPWLFTFAVVFGLLLKANIFEDTMNKKISGVIALVIAFFVTAVGGQTLSTFFVTLFGGAAIYLAGILVVILFFALVGLPTDMKGKTGVGKWAVIAFLVVLAAYIFLVASGAITAGISLSIEATAAVFVVVVIALAVYFMVSGDDEGGAAGGEEPQ